MAEETKTTQAEETKNEPRGKKAKREKIFVPRTSEREEPHLLIFINGKSYQIPRGKESEVPAEVAEEYRRSERARNAAFNNKNNRMAANKP